jgi:hypothetical protein
MLTSLVHDRIVEKHKRGVLVEKRQTANTGSWLETLTNYGGLITSLPSMIYGGTTAPITGAEPKSLVEEVQITQGVKFPEAKRVKIRYGPYRIPPQNEKNFNKVVWNVQGVSTSFHMNVKRPCEEECTILGIEANMEYADGSAANTSSGVSNLVYMPPIVKLIISIRPFFITQCSSTPAPTSSSLLAVNHS